MSSGTVFDVRITLELGGLDFTCIYKPHSSSVQFLYSPLISRVQEIRVISLTADLEIQGQVLLLLCRVLYCNHYRSLQALFHVKKIVTKSHMEFMGPLAVSFFGVSALHGWLFSSEGMRE